MSVQMQDESATHKGPQDLAFKIFTASILIDMSFKKEPIQEGGGVK